MGEAPSQFESNFEVVGNGVVGCKEKTGVDASTRTTFSQHTRHPMLAQDNSALTI